MKLVVNVSTFEPPLTGIGQYTTRLMKALLSSPDLKSVEGIDWKGRQIDIEGIQRLLEESSSTVPLKDSPIDIGVESLAGVSRFISSLKHRFWTCFIAFVRRIPFVRKLKRRFFPASSVKLAANLKEQECSRWDGVLYWEPNYISLQLDAPSVVTVYDLSYLVHPEYHTAEAVAALSANVQHSVQNAKRIITISEFTKQEIAREYGIPSDVIDVVPPAVDDTFRKPVTSELWDELRTRFNLPEQYILSVGTLEPRKNLRGLLRGYMSLPVELRKKFPLVLVGGAGWLSGPLERELQPMIASGEVLRLGYVEQKYMPALYQKATLMAYVSFYEGYGMPVAEAMAAGTAVLTSDRTSMPEVAQGAACLVNPDDTNAITDMLRRVLDDEKLRTQMVAAGLKVSEAYKWEHTIELFMGSLLSAYKSSYPDS